MNRKVLIFLLNIFVTLIIFGSTIYLIYYLSVRYLHASANAVRFYLIPTVLIFAPIIGFVYYMQYKKYILNQNDIDIKVQEKISTIATDHYMTLYWVFGFFMLLPTFMFIYHFLIVFTISITIGIFYNGFSNKMVDFTIYVVAIGFAAATYYKIGVELRNRNEKNAG